jgi:hypothetical protein
MINVVLELAKIKSFRHVPNISENVLIAIMMTLIVVLIAMMTKCIVHIILDFLTNMIISVKYLSNHKEY